MGIGIHAIVYFVASSTTLVASNAIEFPLLLGQSCGGTASVCKSILTLEVMPRLIRRQPLAERIRAYLDPWDFLLWASEEIEGYDWDQVEKDWGLAIGFALNLVFLVARANSRSSGRKAIDDVFGDDGGVPWLSWFVCDPSLLASKLMLISLANAAVFDNRLHLGLALDCKCCLYLPKLATLSHVRSPNR